MSAREARYAQLDAELRRQIIDGDLKPGAPLPSAAELARQGGMSATNVMQALRLLRSEGLVDVRHGSGTYVRQIRPKILRRASQRYPLEKLMVQKPEFERRTTPIASLDFGKPLNGIEFRAEFDKLLAPPDIARTLGVPDGTPLLRRQYHQVDPDTKSRFTLTTSYLTYDLASRNPDLLNAEAEPWPGGTQHQLHTVGVEVSRIIDRVTSRIPLPHERKALDIPDGTPVLAIRKISIDTDDQVVEVADVVLPADRTELEYEIVLPRWAR